MAECPNCGKDVPEGVRMCPNCGFDTGEGQAARVRELREEGAIHPGRLGATDTNDFAGGDPGHGGHIEELPAEDTPLGNPEQQDAGL
jgi:hypothetical protein